MSGRWIDYTSNSSNTNIKPDQLVPITTNQIKGNRVGVAIGGNTTGIAVGGTAKANYVLENRALQRCDIHESLYAVYDGRRTCPACDLEQIVVKLRQQIAAMTNATAIVRRERDYAVERLEGVEGLRDALALIEDEVELTFLARLLDYYKGSPGEYTLAVRHGRHRRGPATIVLRRLKGPDWVVMQHRFVSLGGVALMMAYGQLLRTTNPAEAIGRLMAVIAERITDEDRDEQADAG